MRRSNGSTWRTALWFILTAAIHPLMTVFGIFYVFLLVLTEKVTPLRTAPAAALLFPGFPLTAPSAAYVQCLRDHGYYFLLRWRWYEWLGIFGPLALLWWFSRIARQRQRPVLELLTRSLFYLGAICFIAGLVITIPRRFEVLTIYQPMRSFQLIYLLMVLMAGGLIGESLLKTHPVRWIALFLPLSLGMSYAQFQLFPSDRHVELPGVASTNPWVQAFVWARQNTPVDAIFALNRIDPAPKETPPPAASIMKSPSGARVRPDPRLAVDEPVAAKSIGHTSYVLKVTLRGGATGVYKPRSRRTLGDRRYRGEIAAYRLAAALGLDNVPRAVPRAFDAAALREACSATGAGEQFDREALVDADGTIRGAFVDWIAEYRVLPLEEETWRAKWEPWLMDPAARVPKADRLLASAISTMLAFDYLTANWDRWSGGNVARAGATGAVLYVDNDGAFYERPPPICWIVSSARCGGSFGSRAASSVRCARSTRQSSPTPSARSSPASRSCPGPSSRRSKRAGARSCRWSKPESRDRAIARPSRSSDLRRVRYAASRRRPMRSATPSR